MLGIKGRGYPDSQGLSRNRPPARVAESSPRRWRTFMKHCTSPAREGRVLGLEPSATERRHIAVEFAYHPRPTGVRCDLRALSALDASFSAAFATGAASPTHRRQPAGSPCSVLDGLMLFSRYSARDVRHSSSFNYSSFGVTSESMVTP